MGLLRLPGRIVFAMSGSCSFCGKETREIFGLASVAHRNVRICDECINLCLEILVEECEIKPRLEAGAEFDDNALDEGTNDPELLAQLIRRLAAAERVNQLINTLETAIARFGNSVIAPPRSGFQLECSFCDKSEHEGMTLIAGPTVYICAVA
jgi:ClpX C4-type zinc finger